MSGGWAVVVVAILAGVVGLAELVGRYRSNPTYTLRRSVAAWLYVGINALAGVGALLLIRAMDWTFGQTSHVDLWRVLVAGFGAIAFFRSSLFVARVGNANVGVGPSLVLGALLDACDRQVDRESAKQLAGMLKFEPLLVGLDPKTVTFALPVMCLALMQNFSAADQTQLGAELLIVRNDANLSEPAKMRAVVIQVSKYFGEDVVCRVLQNAPDIFATPPASSPSDLIEKARRELATTEPPAATGQGPKSPGTP
jgi:hypothetical protein